MARSKKVGVSIIFAIGILGCIAALVRMVETIIHIDSGDYIYNFSALMVCSGAELTCGFLIVCVPSLPKAFQAMGLSKWKSTVSFWTRNTPSQRGLHSASKRNNGDSTIPLSNVTITSKSRHNKERYSVIDGGQPASMTKLHHKDSSEDPLDPYNVAEQPENGIIRTTYFEATETYHRPSTASKKPTVSYQAWK